MNKTELQSVIRYLYSVIYQGQELDASHVDEVLKFLTVDDLENAFQRYRDEYCMLINRCWYFQTGKHSVLGRAAYDFWEKLLSLPHIRASASVVLNILAAGQINSSTYKILMKYHYRFDSGIRAAIMQFCKCLLSEGGYKNQLTGKVKKWNAEEQEMLKEIISLYADI